MSSLKLIEHFKDKKVLVAGASGLTGMNLFAFLQTVGADVVGTWNLHKVTYVNGMSMSSDPIDLYYNVDFTDKNQVERLFYHYDFDYVFICAAQSYNAAVCRDNPEALIGPNLQIVSNILAQCLKTKVKKVMYISSATVYQPHSEPIAECELDWNQNPHELYMGIGWVKRYLEKLCEFYATKGLPTFVVRPTNIYGMFDKLDLEKCHVVPAFIMRAINGEDPFVVKSLGDGVKNFIYVDDLIRDMAKIMAFDESAHGVYNLTSDEYASISEVAANIINRVKEINPDYAPHVRFEGRPDAVPFVGLNRVRFDTKFGQEPYTKLTDGLREVVKWYSSLLQIQKR